MDIVECASHSMETCELKLIKRLSLAGIILKIAVSHVGKLCGLTGNANITDNAHTRFIFRPRKQA